MTELDALLKAYREAGEVSLVALAWSRRSSTRLRNGLRRAEDEGTLPFSTIADYMRAGPGARELLCRFVQNLGVRSARELDALIRRFLDEREGHFRTSYRSLGNESRNPDTWPLTPEEQERREKLLQDLGTVTLAQAVEGKTAGARLENAIARGGLGERKMVDLLHGGRAAQQELLRIRNFGLSTLDELIACCRETVIRLLSSRCTSQEMLDRDIALVLDYDPEVQKQIVARLRIGATPEPEPEPPAELELEALLDWGLAVLPERQRDVLARRYGRPDGTPETLKAIGLDFGLTRERIRQLEVKALRRLSRRLPAARLDEALGAAASASWEARTEPFIVKGRAVELRRDLPAGVCLALDLRGEQVQSWLAAGSIVMSNVYLAPGVEAGRIRALASAMERAAASSQLPLPLEQLGLSAEPWEWQVAALETGLVVSHGYLLRAEPTARALRAMRLYRLGDQGPDLLPAVLHRLYRMRHPDDPCSLRDVMIVLHDNPHLFPKRASRARRPRKRIWRKDICPNRGGDGR